MNDSAASDRTAPVADPQSGLCYTPAPAWVRHDAPPAVAAGNLDDFTDQGVVRILHDSQMSLLAAGVATHMHVVQRVLTRAGAERVANLAIEFDPAHDQVQIHSICVRRGEQCIEHAQPGAMQLLRRETQLERLALNGRLTASFVVPDLREGDELEVSFTHSSCVPALSGRYSGWLIFNTYAPWIETRLRLLRPPERRITLKAFNSPPEGESHSAAGCEESRWSLIGQKRLALEDLMPSWLIRNPCYQASEFSTWGEVAQLFASHYRDEVLPAPIAAARDQIAAGALDPATLAVEWLRFVQRSLRYFALSFGVGGLLPRDLETIWTRRFGDCKDAARLYVAGARSLGLDACAALVSTTHGMSLNDTLPATQFFNHAIVRLRIGSRTYWLDPTLPSQTGSLQQLVAPYFGWALPLTEETAALEALPSASPVHLVHCEDQITLGIRAQAPARLQRRLDFGYWEADNVRHLIANNGASKVSSQLLQGLLALWPRVVETGPPTFEEEPGSNRLIMRCAYEIPAPWVCGDKPGQWTFSLLDSVTNLQLAAPKVTRRRSPILLGRPRHISWRATVHMPRRWRGKGREEVLEKPGLRFTSTLSIRDRTLVCAREIVISAWTLPAEEADAYARTAARLKQNQTALLGRVRFGRILPPGRRWSWRRPLIVAAVVIVYEIVLYAVNHR